jgi:hypothetical protein
MGLGTEVQRLPKGLNLGRLASACVRANERVAREDGWMSVCRIGYVAPG